MKLVSAFLQLIRWPNLFFIALTQWLFYYCVVYALYDHSVIAGQRFHHNITLFYLLMAASILIAAGGYIINDYFDRQIDAVNKPTRIVVDRVVKRRWAIVWHLLLTTIGVLIGLYVSYKTGNWLIGSANIVCALLLWFYSTMFKKKLLIGNVIIAALTAWVIVVVYFFAGATLINYEGWQMHQYPFNVKQLYKFTILYAGFAFIVSLIREVVKDLEDMNGDAQYHCNTMPIAWGVPATKVFVAVWTVVCIAALLIVQVYAWQSGWAISAVYSIVLIVAPLVYILQKLYVARIATDYHRISTWIKLVMLAGILSMIFFKYFA
ncbi:MAG: geranylgeranylglycerol-phosphate geranylgeranyltransferase [Ferruginibacter sp.]